MVIIKSESDIKKMKSVNSIVGELLGHLEQFIKPNVTTFELNKICSDFIKKQGAKPAFLGYQLSGYSPFPSSICASVNSCIVHGIPQKEIVLAEGDIIGIDVGTFKDGFYGDGAKTYAVGEISKGADKLMKITKDALDIGIDKARSGNRVGDISFAIGDFITKNGYYVADNLTGHGIGSSLHEDPQIPNSGVKGMGSRLKKGMTLAIEPMINVGTNRVKEVGWECYTFDGSLSAHFEHTILVTDNEPEVLTINK